MSNEFPRQQSSHSKNENMPLQAAAFDKSTLKQQLNNWKKLTQEIDQNFHYVTQQRELIAKEAMLKNAISKEQQAQKIAHHLENKKKEISQLNEEKQIITKELENRQKQLRDITERIMSEIKANELGLKKLTALPLEPSKWIKHKEDCIVTLQAILEQTTKTIIHAKSEKEIITNTINDSTSEDVELFSKAIEQLQHAQTQINEQNNRFEQSIANMDEILQHTNEEYLMTMEDLSTHLIERAEKIVIQEELDDLIDCIRKKNKCEDYDAYVVMEEPNSSLLQSQYEMAKKKMFILDILRQLKPSEEIANVIQKVNKNEYINIITDVERALNISISKYYEDYSKNRDQCNVRKKERQIEIEYRQIDLIEGIKKNVSAVDTLLLPDLKLFEEAIQNCSTKKGEMLEHVKLLSESGIEVSNQINDLNEKKRFAIMHSTKRLEAEKDLATLNKKIHEMEEEETSKRKEIEELKISISKSQKEKEGLKKKNEAEEIRIKAVITKLNGELAHTQDTLGKDIKLLCLSVQQKEMALQALQDGVKNANMQYTSAMESYKFAQNALHSRDTNLPLKCDHAMSMSNAFSKAHVRTETKIIKETKEEKHNYNKSIVEVLRYDNKDMNEKDYQYKFAINSRSKRNSSLVKSTRGNAKSTSNYSYFSTINSSIKKCPNDNQ